MGDLCQKRSGHVFVASRGDVYSLSYDLDLICRFAPGAIFSENLRDRRKYLSALYDAKILV
jgi:hypothetical protein